MHLLKHRADRPPATTFKWYWILLAAALLQQVGMNWMVEYVPLTDLPAHAARAYITAHLTDDAVFAQHYTYHLRAYPNAGIDLILTPLIGIFGPAIAVKLFLSLLVGLYIFGCHSLVTQVRGHVSYLAIIASLTAINWIYLYGFVNYLLGLSLFLIAISCYLRWRKSWSLVRALTIGCLAFAMFLSHLSAVVFLAAAIVVIEAVEHDRVRLVYLGLGGLLASRMVIGILRSFRPDSLADLRWGNLLSKAIGLLIPLRGYDSPTDVLCTVLFGGIMIWIAAGSLRSTPRPPKPFGQAIAMTGLTLFVLYLVTPSAVGTLSWVDIRAVIPCEVLLLAALSVDDQSSKAIGAIGLASAFLFLHNCSTAWEWTHLSRGIERQIVMLSGLPVHSTIYPMVYEDQMVHDKRSRSLAHVVSYTTLTRRVISGDFWHNLLEERQEMPRYQLMESETVRAGSLDTLLQNYQYLWCYKLKPEVLAYLGQHADSIASTDGATLFHSTTAHPVQTSTNTTDNVH